MTPYRFNHVLVAIDGSEGADRVAHHAHCPVVVVR
jgi:nucleotide-binding universal stress UspA family protein